MLARALALEPAVLLLDEPTAALDQRARDAVEETLLDLRDQLSASLILRHARPSAGPPARQPHPRARRWPHPQPHPTATRVIGAIHLSLWQVAATLSLVAVAALVSIWQRADLERDIVVAMGSAGATLRPVKPPQNAFEVRPSTSRRIILHRV
jgi:hypothetical protein